MSTFTGDVLALDLARKTGWACGGPGNVPRFGTVMFGEPTNRARTYRDLREWLEGMVKVAKLELVVFESAATQTIQSGKTTIETIKMLIGLTEHVEEFFYDSGIMLREASVSQVRSHFLGSNPKRDVAKQMVMARCREKGWNVRDDNAGDACALWDYQMAFLRPDLSARSGPLFSR